MTPADKGPKAAGATGAAGFPAATGAPAAADPAATGAPAAPAGPPIAAAAEPQPAARPTAITRRMLLNGAAGTAVLLGIGAAGRFAFASQPVLRPPGGQDEESFLASCIKCSRCRSVCPTSAIAVSGLEDGLASARTPRMDFRSGRYALPPGHEAAANAAQAGAQAGAQPAASAATADGLAVLTRSSGASYCNFCMLCIQNCPTGALAPFDPGAQWIGEAVVVSERCIAFDKRGGCRKCVDYCPFAAISLDGSEQPVVDPARCNGCGVCENICPTDTYRTYQGDKRRGINVVVTSKGRPA